MDTIDGLTGLELRALRALHILYGNRARDVIRDYWLTGDSSKIGRDAARVLSGLWQRFDLGWLCDLSFTEVRRSVRV